MLDARSLTLLAILFLLLGINFAQGGSADFFLHIATDDPFAPPGSVASVNDVTLFGGLFADRFSA